MKIIYWSDYACPYCYIGEARLKKAVHSLISEMEGKIKVEVEMKAFQLDPYAPVKSTGDTQTRFADKYGISFEAAGRQIDAISKMGRDEGLDFNYASTLFTNTMDAHRLTKFAESSGGAALAERIIEELFKAYFTDNKELADHAVLQSAGEKAGLNSNDIKELLTSDKFKDEVRKDELEAAELGVRGVPFFVIADKYTISGAQSTEGMKAVLTEALHEEQKNLNTIGLTCGADGCNF